MHICFLCNEYPPGSHGGIGTFTQTLARKLPGRGHQATVLGIYDVPHASVENDCGVHVHRLPMTRLPCAGFLFNGLRLRREISRLQQKTPITLLEGPESSFALLEGNLVSTRMIRMHGGHHFFSTTLGFRPRPWRSWLERRSFARASYFCAVSRFVAEETRRLLGLGSTPVEILPNPVDTERFRPMPQVPSVPGLIVFVGTLCEKKGIRQLLQAMPEVLSAVPHATLVAFGRDSKDKATRHSYRDGLVAALACETRGRVSFKDHLDHARLPAQLAAASVLVYPSHMEAQGLVIVEGMAMGKPVVASKTGPGPELVEHGVSGLLCDPHDPHSIAEAVIRALRDSGSSARLGAAARRRALEGFSLDTLVGKNEDFYHRCTQAEGHA